MCGYTQLNVASLEPSINCVPQIQPLCSAALLPENMTVKSEVKNRVYPQTTIDPDDPDDPDDLCTTCDVS